MHLRASFNRKNITTVIDRAFEQGALFRYEGSDVALSSAHVVEHLINSLIDEEKARDTLECVWHDCVISFYMMYSTGPLTIFIGSVHDTQQMVYAGSSYFNYAFYIRFLMRICIDFPIDHMSTAPRVNLQKL
jgi:hypothetical protein